MNADCTKPSVAPKPRFVCHSSLKWPSPLMSTARGPKPTIAPKPKATTELNGNQGNCLNGRLETGDDDEGHYSQNDLDNAAAAEEGSNTYILLPKDLENGLWMSEERETTKEEREEEEDMIQKTDEDWRLTDSALTEEVDSLETLWVSEVGLTANSEEVVEMVDTDMTEDMDAERLDAGEALADTDGISMGDISVNSIDEEAGGCAGDWHTEEGRKKDDETADDLTESLTEDPFMNGAETKVASSDQEREDEPATECDGHRRREKGEHKQRNATKKHFDVDVDPVHEPYYVSSEDNINKEVIPRSIQPNGLPERQLLPKGNTEIFAEKCEERAENGKAESMTCDNYVKLDKNGFSSQKGDKNLVRTYQKKSTEGFLNHFDCPPRFRLVSISVPTKTENSLSSSVSESQLLSLNNSDVFRDEEDLEGHIVPFLDDTTDTEQDISEDHFYEEPGQSSEGENVSPFDVRTTELRSGSVSHRVSNMAEMGVQFVHKPYTSGFGQPAMSSSPMLSSMHHKTYNKPHYLSLYPRSISMEAQDVSSGVYSYMEGSPRQGGAICSSGSFSRCSPLSLTPTSVSDIPPPFELAYITKRPITKSSPSLFVEGDTSEKNRKKKSSIKRFLMLKFRRKTENKSVVDVSPTSFKTSVESSPHMPSRCLDPGRFSTNSSPQLNLRSVSKSQFPTDPAPTFLFYKDSKRKGNSVAFLNRSVVRVESFEDRSRVPSASLPLTKPRSISFPNTDTSDYENVPAINSDYENLQVPQHRPVQQAPFTDFFDHPSRVTSSANETDGYVDMSSLPGFRSKTQSSEQEAESAYTEAYNVCSVALAPKTASVADKTVGEEDQGRTSEEEEAGAESNYDRQPEGRSRAFYIAKDLMDTERLHVKSLKLLQEDFRDAVGAAVGDEGDPGMDEERLREILNELPDVYTLHRRILDELENRIRHWEESQKIADIFLSRKAEFLVFTTYIGHYDRSMSLLEDSCQASPAFAAIVHQFEQSPAGEKVSLKHQLLQVIVRVAQYRMLLTDYLNNLSPDSQEYEDTQAAVDVVSDIADQANDSLKHGENLLRLVNIEYSVLGQQDLLQPGRVFVKEGTLMKVCRKSRQPRHLFLMNDVLLYTYPQQDGKYRLKNTLQLTGLKVSKPFLESAQNVLRIEVADISITLSASSFIEREDWFYTLSRTVTEHARGSSAFKGCLGEARDGLRLALGEKAPTLVPVSQVMMCMNCTSDFSLTLRRHHCHGCGRIVCRSCSRNRYPLKYMNDRMAKVCDHCYTELKKKGGDVSSLSGKGSPRPNRSSRPLSAVFQNIHPPNIWRHRKGTATFTQVTVSEEGSISGSLQCSKRSKRSWKRLWFLLKDKVLYTYRAQEEKVASESLPLLGFTVKLPDRHEGEEEANIFQLYHKNTLYYTFKASDNYTAQRWVNAMEEATVL